MKKIVYTDLDGTILDHDTYSYKESKESLEILKKINVPVVFCTSKTRFEIEKYREKLGNIHPFISENGGGIFIPKDYFSFNFEYDEIIDNYKTIILGETIDHLIKVLNVLKKKYGIRSFIDMNLKDIAKNSNFTIDDAALAKKREFEIPFQLKNKEKEKEVLEEIKSYGLNCMVGGRYYHLAGKNSKGRSVKILDELYKKEFKKIFTYGFGDSANDFSMLDSVDEGYLVKKKDKTYSSEKYRKAPDIGPKGFSKSIKKLFSKN